MYYNVIVTYKRDEEVVWREGPPLTVLCQSLNLLAGPSPFRQSQIQTKKEYCFPATAATPHSEHWPVFWRLSST